MNNCKEKKTGIKCALCKQDSLLNQVYLVNFFMQSEIIVMKKYIYLYRPFWKTMCVIVQHGPIIWTAYQTPQWNLLKIAHQAHKPMKYYTFQVSLCIALPTAH